MSRKRTFLVCVLCTVVGAAAGAGGIWLKYRDEVEFAEKYTLLAEAEKIIKENKVPAEDAANIDSKLINGYLDAYDKYTFYYEKSGKTLQSEIDYVNSTPCLDSCGYRIDADDSGRIRIASVDKGGTADKHGLMAGDVFLKIDGVDVTVDTMNHVRDLFGEDGTVKSFVMERDGKEIAVDFVLTNKPRIPDFCLEADLIDGHVLRIKIEEMTSMLEMYFARAIEEYIGKADAVILDLRDNPGGETDSALYTAGKFIGEGYVHQYYYTGKEETLNVSPSETLIDLPIVILVNEETASAAEILTALLKQYGNATIVGSRTFGKGIFQEESPLGNGTLHYTAGYYTVGDWECYQGVGIEPDVSVEMDSSLMNTKDDIQLEKALELIG
jgi:carboxyl-terminal-processing protease